mmetsp:Transcript_93588/g.162537  ORF Transcript_93588/g.162537 Transcript_93588/m.162537 type:complete len:83 (-) Transcript_93588:171-419(-)
MVGEFLPRNLVLCRCCDDGLFSNWDLNDGDGDLNACGYCDDDCYGGGHYGGDADVLWTCDAGLVRAWGLSDDGLVQALGLNL